MNNNIFEQYRNYYTTNITTLPRIINIDDLHDNGFYSFSYETDDHKLCKIAQKTQMTKRGTHTLDTRDPRTGPRRVCSCAV